jgi:signal transduction histidine kinase
LPNASDPNWSALPSEEPAKALGAAGPPQHADPTSSPPRAGEGGDVHSAGAKDRTRREQGASPRTPRLRERLRRQEHLLRATSAVSSSLRLEEVLARLVHEAALSTDSSGADIHVVDSANRMVIVRAGCREAASGVYTPLNLSTGIRYPFEEHPLMLKLIEHHQPVMTRGRHDPGLAPHEHEWMERNQVHATMGVPIIVGAELLAILVLFRLEQRTRPFTEDDLQSGRFIAGQAGIALENVRLFERTEAINSIAQAVTSALELDAILATVTEQIRRLISGAGVSLTTYLPETDEMHIQATTPELADLCRHVIGTRVPAEGTALLRAWRTQAPVLIRDVLAPDVVLTSPAPRDWQRIAEGGVRCFAHVPVTFDGRCLAILSVARTQPDSLTAADVELLAGVSRHLGIAVHHALYRDELRRAAEAEKMAALGQLAAGVAHNLNNALAVILGNAQLALMRPGLPETVARSLRRIEQTALDAASTACRIQQFSRQTPPDLRHLVDLNEIAREVCELSRPLWQHECQSRGVAIDFRLELGTVPRVLANPGELCEVMLNLIRNSVQAMPGGGTLALRTTADAESVFLAVVDTGVGMDEETRRRVFEPFFTTKVKGEGTGLGLSVSYGLVAQQGGTITVASHPGEGSTFTLRLPHAALGDAAAFGDRVVPPWSQGEPRHSSAAAPEHPAKLGHSVSGTPGRDRGRSRGPAPHLPVSSHRPIADLLLVDDEPFNREVLTEMLVCGGHRVVAAGSGGDALTCLASTRFDAVITDQSMPGLSGLEVAARVKALRPETPVLLLTGWGAEMLEQLPACVDCILPKPIGMEELLDALEQAIGPGPYNAAR